MSEFARTVILGRLRHGLSAAPPRPAWTPPAYPADERLARFSAMLESFHAEVHLVEAADWPRRLWIILAGKGVRRLLVADDGGETIRRLDAAEVPGKPELIPYDRPVERLKPFLLHEADAALTSTLGGIAETGTLVLEPSLAEPRLMSLLPPIHIALVDETALVDNLPDLLARNAGWAAGMPTNLLLISGPSKTADIEQTLAYGVHGPKELVVLVLRRPTG